MTPRSLFSLILKILGIFFIRNILDAVSRSLSVLVYFPQYSSQREAWFNLGVSLPPLILYSLFVWLLIFRTEWVIKLLRLDSQFDKKIVGMNVHRSVVLSVAVVAASAWILINEIPELFRQVTYYLQERKLYIRMARPDLSSMATSLLRVGIGFILLIFNKTVVNIIEKKRLSTTSWYWPARVPFVKKRKKTSQIR